MLCSATNKRKHTSSDLSNTISVFSHMRKCLKASVQGWFSGYVIPSRTLVLYFCFAFSHCWLFALMLKALWLHNSSYNSMQYVLLQGLHISNPCELLLFFSRKTKLSQNIPERFPLIIHLLELGHIVLLAKRWVSK